MASHIHAAAAGDLPLTGMHDLRLRPRLLRRVLAECLPLPDPAADLQPTRSPADLARALSAVREQGLLVVEGAADPGLLEEWSAAVDAWVDRLVALLASDRVCLRVSAYPLGFLPIPASAIRSRLPFLFRQVLVNHYVFVGGGIHPILRFSFMLDDQCQVPNFSFGSLVWY